LKLLAAIIVSLIALQGCVTDEGLTGTGPVVLTDQQQAYFEEWREGRMDRDPLYFFLVRGGGAYYVYCPDTVGLCRDSLETKSLGDCHARYGAGTCRLYAVYGKVVWKRDQPADPNWNNQFRTPVPEKSVKDIRPIRITWSGRRDALDGTLEYRKSRRSYEITVTIPRETLCTGAAEFTRKTWSLTCRNGVSAEGTFRPLGEGKGSLGEGRDNNGNRIEFRVAPAQS